MPVARGKSAAPKTENTFERKLARQRSSLRNRLAKGKDGLSGQELERQIDKELKKWKKTVAIKAEEKKVKTEVKGETNCKGGVKTEVKVQKKCKGEVMAQPVEASIFDVSPVVMALPVEAPMSDVEPIGSASPCPTLRDRSSSPEIIASPRLAARDRSRSPLRTPPVSPLRTPPVSPLRTPPVDMLPLDALSLEDLDPGFKVVSVNKLVYSWDFSIRDSGRCNTPFFFPDMGTNNVELRAYKIVGACPSVDGVPVTVDRTNIFGKLASMGPSAYLWLEPPGKTSKARPSFLASCSESEVQDCYRRVRENLDDVRRKHPLRVQQRRGS